MAVLVYSWMSCTLLQRKFLGWLYSALWPHCIPLLLYSHGGTYFRLLSWNFQLHRLSSETMFFSQSSRAFSPSPKHSRHWSGCACPMDETRNALKYDNSVLLLYWHHVARVLFMKILVIHVHVQFFNQDLHSFVYIYQLPVVELLVSL